MKACRVGVVMLGLTMEASAGKTEPRRVVQVSAGHEHTCVRLQGGAVRCWGSGRTGALGLGHTETIGDDEPASASSDLKLGGKATFIATGQGYSCAVLFGGRLRCFGDAQAGSLGYGNKHNVGDDETPESVGDVPVGDQVQSISAGGGPTCVVLPAGRLRCWGAYHMGRFLKCPDDAAYCLAAQSENMGIGYSNWRPIGDDETPASVGDLPVAGGRVTQVASSTGHICIVLEKGQVRCWGSDTALLGNAPLTSPSDTATNITLGGPVVQVGVGMHHSCALLQSGLVRCWGYGAYGVLGHGKTQDIDDPTSDGAVPVGAKVTQIAVGGQHTCALLRNGAVRCWGKNDEGQLGYGHTHDVGDNERPSLMGNVKLGGRAVQITCGAAHTCALLDTGAVRCWGQNAHGQLGYGHKRNIGDDEVPAAVPEVPIL